MPKDRPSKSSETDLPEEFTLLRHCPACGHAYGSESFVCIDATSDGKLMHGTCAKCLGSLIVLVARSAMGLGSVASITDLSSDDVKRIYKRQPVSEDDLLAFHGFLKHHSRAFLRLFTT